MENNYILNKEVYKQLWNPNITKSQYDSIISRIDSRFNYIMRTICTKLSWYDYDNGWEETSGSFQPNKYHFNEDSYITFDGEYTMPSPYDSCPDIPIKWLWEDFEDEFKKEVEDFKIRKERDKILAKVKREESKNKRAAMKEVIQSKLTKEELKYIKFK